MPTSSSIGRRGAAAALVAAAIASVLAKFEGEYGQDEQSFVVAADGVNQLLYSKGAIVTHLRIQV